MKRTSFFSIRSLTRTLVLLCTAVLLAAPAHGQFKRTAPKTTLTVDRDAVKKSAEQYAAEARKLREDVTTVSITLQREYKQTADQIVATMYRVGYQAGEIAKATVDGLRIKGEEAATYMVKVGLATRDVAVAIIHPRGPAALAQVLGQGRQHGS